MKTRFYDVHVFYTRNDGYSIGVKIETLEPLTDEQVIEFATDNNMFTDDGDGNHVDYVNEIDEDEYKLLTA
jgi:hypothetical protein